MYAAIRRLRRRPTVSPDAAVDDGVRLVKFGNGVPTEENSWPSNTIKTSKYTPLTFLPLNLMEQLKKAANVYFVVISAFMLLAELTALYITPIGAWTTFTTLSLMMSASACIAAMDDYRRHKADTATNAQPARRVAHAGETHEVSLSECSWADVKVGDILLVMREEEFPADLVILASTGEAGTCYVSTSNLDGESSLKVKCATQASQSALLSPMTRTSSASASNAAASLLPLSAISHALLGCALQRLGELEGSISAEKPQRSIYAFNGSLCFGGATNQEKLDAKNLLLRGTQLRNTGWCLGVVVYTGRDTRMAMNSRKVPSKLANLERVVNKAMLVVLSVQALLALVSDVLYCLTKSTFTQYWYLFPGGDTSSILLPDIVGYWFTFAILYSNLMPISTYATMEFCNFFQAYFIESDLGMYDAIQDCPAAARSTNLCHELGQVSVIFSDKTGTLTQNIMELKRVSIAGEIYGQKDSTKGFGGRAALQAAATLASKRGMISNFLEILAVSHSVVAVEDPDDKFHYEAESPDEGALVEAAKQLGWVFRRRTGQAMMLLVGHGDAAQSCTYEVLALNAFTSARKRMSVVVRAPSGKCLLLAKGADDTMLEHSVRQDSYLERHLQEFAKEGLRTLVLGRRLIDDAELGRWMQFYEQAQAAPEVDRERLLAAAAEVIEVDMEIIGATAIEDKLQDGVPRTVARLREAGIRLWVLTGDKLETALNVAYGASVVSDDMEVLVLDVQPGVKPLKEQLEELASRLREVETDDIQTALIITGQALSEATALQVDDELARLATCCSIVIACRVAPLQKAQVVSLVRRCVQPTPVTLAVGDGANDVPMIQEAQVGIGISGREGRQAVNASDFSIAQFQFLERLLLIHGRWDYLRTCKIILYNFWKNAVLVLMLFYYTLVSGFSGTSMFESIVWTSFNVVLYFPIIATGLFDRDVSESQALEHPWLYETGRLGLNLNVKKMAETLLSAFVKSLILLIVSLLTIESFEICNVGDYYTYGTTVYTWLVITMNYRVAFITITWNALSVAAWVSGFVLYIVFITVYCLIDMFDPSMYMVAYHMVSNWLFWIGALSVPALALMIDVFKAYVLLEFFPDRSDLVLEQAKAGTFVMEKTPTDRRISQRALIDDDLVTTSRSYVDMNISTSCDASLVRSRSRGSSFDFSHPNEPVRRVQTLAHSTPLQLDAALVASMIPHSVTTQASAGGSADCARQTSNRPSGSAFAQQALPSWQFVFGWWEVLVIALVVGTLLTMLGAITWQTSTSVGQIYVQYAGDTRTLSFGVKEDEFHYMLCPEGANGSTKSCTFDVRVPQDMSPPISIFYTLEPFFQNYNSYLTSVIYSELEGQDSSAKKRLEVCAAEATRVTASGDQIIPCGLQATSIFNDTFEVLGMSIDTEGIAWDSDLRRFANPADFPNRSNTSWIYQRYPYVADEVEGVKNGHVAVWMRPGAALRVMKPYGFLHETLHAGQNLTLRINSSFPVASLNAHKQLILTTTNALGGRNGSLGVLLCVGGVFGYVIALCIVAVRNLCPRSLGKPRGGTSTGSESEDGLVEAMSASPAASVAAPSSSRQGGGDNQGMVSPSDPRAVESNLLMRDLGDSNNLAEGLLLRSAANRGEDSSLGGKVSSEAFHDAGSSISGSFSKSRSLSSTDNSGTVEICPRNSSTPPQAPLSA